MAPGFAGLIRPTGCCLNGIVRGAFHLNALGEGALGTLQDKGDGQRRLVGKKSWMPAFAGITRGGWGLEGG